MVTAISPRPKRHNLAFIVNSSIDKPDAKARQLIRSHVMRDKNRRKPPADASKLKSWINEESSQTSVALSDLYFPLPVHIGSGMPLTQLACDMPPYALDLVYKFFTVLLQQMYPIELCLSFDLQHSVWIQYLALDPLYCHSLLWTTQTYFDWLNGSGVSPIQIQHAHQTLVGLRERLTLDAELATSDATIVVVVSLIMMNAFVGDYKSARKHVRGLHKMVEMRGGVRAFGGNTQIQLKMCRADLAMAIFTNRKPLFFSDGICWEPYIAKNTSRKTLPPHMAALDSNLLHIWADLREFTRSANLAFQTGQKIDCVLFQEILVSVQYRLLLLDVSAGSLDEVVLVGMLAFATNIFLQMQGLGMRFDNLSARLRGCVSGLQGLGDDATAELKLWLLFVAWMPGGASKQNSWIGAELKKTLGILALTKWEVVRDRLKRYLWIDVLHDKGGKDAFKNATENLLQTLRSSEIDI
ncbi:hypothetical protein LHYA1_G005806 [Lachnellula hyalina]|uniref:Uncharacterized protein n=1 Tax=Lachnellula hyalina TaxID=1316788 RepID=A0A8H8R0N8_9HELO|nr:uncharacterized protein LHYA1_G005806 [Lachnellula hyalina]TVY26283.1 hypothetical protein LHYA1_G005806 [Lachnellula hyalina]